MSAEILRTDLKPSPALRWHPWAPLVVAGLFVLFVFALGAAWGFSAEKRMAADEQVYTQAGWRTMQPQLERTRPARETVEKARYFDAAVIRAAREAQANESAFHRMRISLEDSIFGFLEDRRHARDGFDLRAAYRESARLAAEHRLANLSGTAVAWSRTASLCEESVRGWDMGAELERTAAAYSAVLGRTITAERLAPLSGMKCD